MYEEQNAEQNESQSEGYGADPAGSQAPGILPAHILLLNIHMSMPPPPAHFPVSHSPLRSACPDPVLPPSVRPFPAP